MGSVVGLDNYSPIVGRAKRARQRLSRAGGVRVVEGDGGNCSLVDGLREHRVSTSCTRRAGGRAKYPLRAPLSYARTSSAS